MSSAQKIIHKVHMNTGLIMLPFRVTERAWIMLCHNILALSLEVCWTVSDVTEEYVEEEPLHGPHAHRISVLWISASGDTSSCYSPLNGLETHQQRCVNGCRTTRNSPSYLNVFGSGMTYACIHFLRIGYNFSTFCKFITAVTRKESFCGPMFIWTLCIV